MMAFTLIPLKLSPGFVCWMSKSLRLRWPTIVTFVWHLSAIWIPSSCSSSTCSVVKLCCCTWIPQFKATHYCQRGESNWRSFLANRNAVSQKRLYAMPFGRCNRPLPMADNHRDIWTSPNPFSELSTGVEMWHLLCDAVRPVMCPVVVLLVYEMVDRRFARKFPFFLVDINLLLFFALVSKKASPSELSRGILFTISILSLLLFFIFAFYLFILVLFSLWQRCTTGPFKSTRGERRKVDSCIKIVYWTLKAPVQFESYCGNNWPLLFWVSVNVTMSC